LLEPDGVYRYALPLTQAPHGLWQAEIAALHPGPGDKVLALPATLPKITAFLEASGEYSRLPGRLWPRLLRLVDRAAAFERAEESVVRPDGIPFNPTAARRERFIPLKLLISWLQRLPGSGGYRPDLALFALAQRHIEVGHLKTYGSAWNYVPETFDSAPQTVEATDSRGEIIGQTTIFADIVRYPADANDPLIDIHEFAAWFRALGFEGLALPAEFPERSAVALSRVGGGVSLPDTTGRDSALEEPEWPTIREVAAAFEGLHGWNEARWKQNLGGSNRASWITRCLQRPGKQGRAVPIRVHPVRLALGLVAKAEDSAAATRELDCRFISVDSLKPWQPHWEAARGGLQGG